MIQGPKSLRTETSCPDTSVACEQGLQMPREGLPDACLLCGELTGSPPSTGDNCLTSLSRTAEMLCCRFVMQGLPIRWLFEVFIVLT